MSRKLMLIGGGGHCRSVLDSAIAMGIFEEIGFVDSDPDKDPGVPYLGRDEDIPELVQKGWEEAFVTVGSIGNTEIRERIYRNLKNSGLSLPVIQDPSAIVARDCTIGEGTYIGKKVVVNAGAVIKSNTILNSGCIVEHDCRVGSFAHISPGAVLCGEVVVGDGAHVGAGAVVRQGIRIGAHSLIGVGSVVVKDVPEGVKAFGNPCKVASE